MSVQPAPTTAPQPSKMPPDVVFVKLDVATRRAWIVPEGMVVWALARAQHPGRADDAIEQTNGVQRLVATCRAMLDAELGGENPSPLARAPQRDPQGRLLVDSHGFERLLNGGLVGAAAAALPPTVAQALTARIHTLSRTPLRRLVTALASDLEGGVRRGAHDSPLGSSPPHRPKSIPSTAANARISAASSPSSNVIRDGAGARSIMAIERGNDAAGGRRVMRNNTKDSNFADDGSKSAGADGGGGDDDGDDAIVSRFVRERCVRRGESCLADALYRSFVTWAPVNARTMARTDFWRAIAAHAVHGFDVDGRAHIVSGLSVSLNNNIAASPQSRQGYLPRVASATRAAADDVVESEPRRRLPSGDADAVSDGWVAHATSNTVKAEPADEGPSAAHREEFEDRVAKEVRCDPATGYVAAIDLIFEAADVWGSPQGRKLAARVIYSMRQAGWNFEKRRVGPGRATPLVRAVDVDDFLNAAATFAGRDRAALALACYHETASYRRLMTRLGHHRDPLGRRAAAVHAYECIATHTAASASTPTATPTEEVEASPRAAHQDSVSSKSTQSLLRRRSRMDQLDTRAAGMPPSPLLKRATIDRPDDNDGHHGDSVAPKRRVRRRISISSDEENNGGSTNKQEGQRQNRQREEDTGEGHETKGADARRRDTYGDGREPHPTVHLRPQFSPDQRRPTQTHAETDTRPQPPISTRSLPSKTLVTIRASDSSSFRDGDDATRHYRHPFERTQTTATARQGVAVKTEPAGDSVDPLLVTMSDEAVYNGRLVDDMAARVAPGSALCVWRRAAGVWRLLLAARPGSDRRRPWRLVGGTHASEPSGALKGDAVRWIEWSKVRLTAVELFSTSPYTVLSIDAECEPPGDDPDADSIGVVSSWLFVACREWAAGRWMASDAVMSALALRIAETAAADPDAPHAPEAVAIAKACVRRLHQNHPRPMPSGDRNTA